MQIITIPLIFLISVMIIDYLTGISSAYINKKLSSKTGIVGILKKIGYIALVCVGVCADYLIQTVLVNLGIDFNVQTIFGFMVAIWLIINELISILENLSKMGVPMPNFLMKLVKKLKIIVESKADSTIE
ncbi:MAG: phage holin family protein [Acutalibacteraceae bacterium]